MDDNVAAIRHLTWHPVISFFQQHVFSDAYDARTFELEARLELSANHAEIEKSERDLVDVSNQVDQITTTLNDMRAKRKTFGPKVGDEDAAMKQIRLLDQASQRRLKLQSTLTRARNKQPRLLERAEQLARLGKIGKPKMTVEEAQAKAERMGRFVASAADDHEEAEEARVMLDEDQTDLLKEAARTTETTFEKNVVDVKQQNRIDEFHKQFFEDVVVAPQSKVKTLPERYNHILGSGR